MIQRDSNDYGNNNSRSAEEIERYRRSLFSFIHLKRDKKEDEKNKEKYRPLLLYRFWIYRREVL
ncbi:MAG: hypothetical protein LE178_00575 [Endomicrobium sp.]|jgi:hypothetical protein|nr:hypothetical protein [Endomicrobium sp.]